ncbi:MAG: lysophospholipase [Candidatus Omnitrophica bacterium]|nr:lysophospholipase [Candidatus Omnitrophota bacterium]
MKTEGSFKNKDAQNIFYRAFIPEKPKAAVILVHGLGEHSAKYNYFAEDACKKGMAFFAYDQRGNGRSGGFRCHVDRFDDLVEDLRQFVGIAKIESLCDDAFIVGLSMGGLTSLLFSMKYGGMIKGAVVCAPALRFVSPPTGIEAGMAGLLSFFLPRLTTPNRVPFEYLSHDKELVEKTKGDKQSHRVISFRLFSEATKAAAYALENAASVKVPLLLLQGTGDKVVDPSGTKEFFRKMTFADKEIKLYDGLYHELLRETERQEITDYILGWIAKRA